MRRLLFAFLVVLVSGPSSARAQVAVQAYALPSGGGFPHDVAVECGRPSRAPTGWSSTA